MKAFNLTESATKLEERGAFGTGKQNLGMTTIGTLTAGNCTLSNVPVAVANDDSSMNDIGRPNGLFGLRELVRYGAVLDFSHRLIYLRPSRPGNEVAASIKSILLQNNYKAIPLSLEHGHLRVPGRVNDIACHFWIDSGAYFTALDGDFAARHKFGGALTRYEAHGIGKSSVQVRAASFSSLWIGDYQIKRASATILPLDSTMLGRGTSAEVNGLIGVEYLRRNLAIFDFISGTMYQRPRPN